MTNMTKKEIYQFMNELSKVFDIVRLVDVSETAQFYLDESGEPIEAPYRCYAVWNKNQRCENCISAKAFAKKTKMSKFEFVNDETYHVVAQYVEIEGTPFILEMVSKFTDDMLFSAYGKNEFVKTITSFNKKMYVDPLTKTYNRRYYEEQLYGLSGIDVVAIIDIDNFKSINDSFGHPAGDAVLRKVAGVLLSNVRDTDSVVRYGGDEFLMLFRRITKKVCMMRLETTRKIIHESVFSQYPELTISVSIGGIYCGGRVAEAIPEADRLLYTAKTMKNNVAFGTFSKEKSI